jgi:hypothetical protein
MTKRFLSSLVLFFALRSSILAQQESIPDTLLSGHKALTFSFSGLNLGGGLGGKYWLDNYYCIRVTLTGSHRNNNDNGPLLYSYSYNYNTSSTELGINIGLARKFMSSPPLLPYVGIAANVSQDWSKIERVYRDSTETEKVTRSRYGGVLFIGAEYWITENISFSGEQSILLSYNKDEDSNSFSIGNSTSSLILSVYF